MDEQPIFPVDLDQWRTELARSGERRAAARRRYEDETQKLQHRVIAASRAGMSQAEISRVAGIPRITVRDWLGLK